MSRLLLVIFILIAVNTPLEGSAQDQWDFEERCIAPAALGTWSFDGTILMTGYGGLHGVNAAWDTPRVLARVGRYPNGILSPDGRWYAGFRGDVIYAESYNHEHIIEGIRVFSTLGDSVVHDIPWQNSWLQMWGYRQMYWMDNRYLLYEYSDDYSHVLEEIVILDPFNGTKSQWETKVDVIDGGSGFNSEYIQYPSPDFSLTIYYDYTSQSNARFWRLYNLATGEMVSELNTQYEAVAAWLPDSSGFVIEMVDDDDHTNLVYYDRNGNKVETVVDLDASRIFTPQNIRWSPDGRYLALRASQKTLMIADTQTKSVLDTCLSTAIGFAWSPDGTQLAFLERGYGIKKVYVVDLTSWSVRAVARHIVQTDYWDQIIGWRSDH